MRRFWTDVTVAPDGDGHGIRLDARPVRTPGRVSLLLPNPALAEAVADEWRAVGETLDLRAMPLTGLANAAIDRVAPDRRAFAATLSRYADSDLLYYRATEPAPLVERQRASWDPLLAWARARYDVHFVVVDGIMPRAQPPATLDRLTEAVAARSAWELAGLSPVVTISGTLIGGLALVERAVDADAVWQAGQVDEDWQIEQWGEDALAVEARETRRRDFDAGARFLALLDRAPAG